jgi:hypothetical protein
LEDHGDGLASVAAHLLLWERAKVRYVAVGTAEVKAAADPSAWREKPEQCK